MILQCRDTADDPLAAVSNYTKRNTRVILQNEALEDFYKKKHNRVKVKWIFIMMSRLIIIQEHCIDWYWLLVCNIRE